MDANEIINRLPGSPLSLAQLFSNAINGFLTLIAIVAFFSLIYSGIMFITAGGDEKKATDARKNIIYALTGVLVATLSLVIISVTASLPTMNLPAGNNNNNTTNTQTETQDDSTALVDSDSDGYDDRIRMEVDFGAFDSSFVFSNNVSTSNNSATIKLNREPNKEVNCDISSEGVNLTAYRAADDNRPLIQFRLNKDNYKEGVLVNFVYTPDSQAAGTTGRITISCSAGGEQKISTRIRDEN